MVMASCFMLEIGELYDSWVDLWGALVLLDFTVCVSTWDELEMLLQMEFYVELGVGIGFVSFRENGECQSLVRTIRGSTLSHVSVRHPLE